MNDRYLPPEFDPDFYRSTYADLRSFGDTAAALHYETHGKREGRSGNAIRSRADLVKLIPPDATTLEIGPYYSPLLRGPKVKYFDILSRDQMIERARREDVGEIDPPHIHYTSPTGDLSVVTEKFDYAISSFCIEHQMDFVRHLENVNLVLKPGGRYFILSPDKRYCHDHFRAESTIADVLDAYYAKRTRHTMKEVIEHFALSAHNDSSRHWNDDHGDPRENRLDRLWMSVKGYQHAEVEGHGLDVHSWYFTPQSMREIISDLRTMELCNLQVERCYDTRRPFHDFWMILRRPPDLIF